MDKIVDVLFGMAIAIGVLMMSVCMMLLPDNPPPEWVGYAAIIAMAVLMGMACLIGLYGSVTSYNRNN